MKFIEDPSIPEGLPTLMYARDWWGFAPPTPDERKLNALNEYIIGVYAKWPAMAGFPIPGMEQVQAIRDDLKRKVEQARKDEPHE